MTEQARLFDVGPEVRPWLGRERRGGGRIEEMHEVYGCTPGRLCGDCAELTHHRQAAVYYKCRLYGVTASVSTDWRKKWPACGKFREAE